MRGHGRINGSLSVKPSALDAVSSSPHRTFPIEMHTALPVLHYLPAGLHRRLLGSIGFDYWASEDRLNLLDARSLRSLFPTDREVAIDRIRIGGVVSNLIAHGDCASIAER
jgi:hypothetical protein